MVIDLGSVTSFNQMKVDVRLRTDGWSVVALCYSHLLHLRLRYISIATFHLDSLTAVDGPAVAPQHTISTQKLITLLRQHKLSCDRVMRTGKRQETRRNRATKWEAGYWPDRWVGINAAPKKKYMSLYEKRTRCITVFFHARKRNRSILFVPNYIEFNSDLTLGKLVSLPAIISKYKRKIPNEFRIKK